MNRTLQAIHEAGQSASYRVALLVGCHQRSDRSYFVKSRQIPLCARCLGILAGVPLISLFPIGGLVTSAMLISPMLLDGFSQALGWRESRNGLRFITGCCFSIGIGGLLIRVLKLLWIT
jgi:uncharacterized membrane protein